MVFEIMSLVMIVTMEYICLNLYLNNDATCVVRKGNYMIDNRSYTKRFVYLPNNSSSASLERHYNTTNILSQIRTQYSHVTDPFWPLHV